MPERKPRVLIADDDSGAREMLSNILFKTLAWESVLAACGQEALDIALPRPPEIALSDVRMPGPSGMELAARLKEFDPEVKVIIITAFDSTQDAAEAMYDDAFYYLPKPLDLERLLEIVQEAWAARRARLEALGKLTRREREVLDLLAEGKTDGEIADLLSVSVRTVNNHVCNILDKSGAKNRVQVALLWNRYLQKR